MNLASVSIVPKRIVLTVNLTVKILRLSPLERAAFLLHDVFGVSISSRELAS